MFGVRAVVAALVTAALLGACSDDEPEPKVAEPSDSAVASQTADPVLPTPSSTEAPTARQSVDAWLAAWSSALQTGDTTAVRRLSTRDCDSCQRIIAKVEEVYGKGGRYVTAGWSASRVSEAPDSVAATPSFIMQVLQERRVLVGADGTPVDTADRTRIPMRMTFRREGQHWALMRLEVLE